MKTLLLLAACCLVGCDAGPTVTTDTDTPPGCESGQCPIDGGDHMTTLLLLEACCLVGCDSGTTVTTDTDTPPGCESGQCPIDGENATFFDPEIGAHTHATDDCPDCFRRRPPESGTPQPTPPFKFDFPGDEKPAPETKPVPPPTQKEGPNVDLIIALVSTVLGMAGAYAASRLDDNPDNDFSITDLAKDVAAKIAKARL